MKISTLSVKNFYSFKNLDLNLDDYSGIVRILGINKDSGASNGAGKSVIFEAIVWGIFGKTIRKSTEESLVNSDVGQDCSVDVVVHKDGVGILRIVRTKRPTSLTFYVNNVVQNKENASETQKHIEEILETDYKSFLASVVFGQHSDFTFLDSSPEDKRKIIRNCFNLDDLFGKRMAVKQLKSGYSAELKVINTFLDKLTKEQSTIKSQIPDTKYKFIEIPNLESILEAEREINSIDNSIRDMSSDLKKNRDKLRKVSEALHKGVSCETQECPVCKTSYEKIQTQTDVDKLQADYDQLTDDILSLEGHIVTLKDRKISITPQYSSVTWAKYNEKNKLIENAQKSIDKLQEIEKEIADYQEKAKKLESLLEVMKFWELAFSEKGLIKYIIRSILDYFNIKSNEYLSILTNNQFSIEFNDELTEMIRNNGVPTKYISLSGGEKRKVNLAIMLALQELSSKISRTNCNFLIFDEVCDNIDDQGIDALKNLFDYLQGQYNDKIVFIISHNNRLQDLLSESQQIVVKKKKGVSSLEYGN